MEQKNNTQEITVNQLIGMAFEELGNISVPAKYKEQIADPICSVMNKLGICLNAFRRNDVEQMRKAKEQPNNGDSINAIQEVSEDQVPEDANVVDLGEFGGE